MQYKNGGGGGTSSIPAGSGGDIAPDILNTWVSGDKLNTNDFEKMTRLANTSKTTANELQSAFSRDQDWRVGDDVNLNATSFTRGNLIKDETLGQVSWRSDRKGIILIKRPKRGFDVPYDRVNVKFYSGQEKEIVVAGRYRVKEVRQITEPGTREVDEWTTKLYVLEER